MAGVQHWILGFFDIGRPRFIFSPFLKKGFRHVMAFGWDSDKELWLVMDWSKRGISVAAMNNNECDALIDFIMRHNGKFLMIKAKKASFKFPVMPCWCVTAVRHLIGIKRPYFTPYQLYCAVRKMGGKPMFEGETEPEVNDGRTVQQTQSACS